MGSEIRARLLDAASDITCTRGWSEVTMGKLADLGGVSRQTVYNEIGSKNALAEALIMRELDRFLTVVRAEMAAYDDVVGALRAASRATLELAEVNPLLHAVLSASHGADNDLLPLLTTHSTALIQTAAEVIRAEVARFEVVPGTRETEIAIESVVRLVLSHVMQPAHPPARTAEDIAVLVGPLLGPQLGRQ